jgi:5-methylcytosine-specific restriction endonuclease McrA
MSAFSKEMQLAALERQHGKCASCGTLIATPGKAGAAQHEFGESAEGHHMIPQKLKGPTTVENCVVVCKSCHYSVHRGGDWKYTDQYKSIEYRPMSDKISAIARLYPHYR